MDQGTNQRVGLVVAGPSQGLSRILKLPPALVWSGQYSPGHRVRATEHQVTPQYCWLASSAGVQRDRDLALDTLESKISIFSRHEIFYSVSGELPVIRTG